MPGNLGPPEREEPGPTPETGPRHTTTRSHHEVTLGASHCSTSRQCGRYADAWRQGFSRGFRDALRLAAREVYDPAVWVVLDRLADDYGLVGGE